MGEQVESGDAHTAHDSATDDDGSRLDRELNELLQELRVVLPGIQVLFAFLLAVPFAQGFEHVTDGQRRVFFAAFVATALSSALLMAPSVQHRLRWRQFDKERLLRTSNRLAIAGTMLMALAIDAAVYLVADVVFDHDVSLITAAVVMATFVTFWLWIPILRSSKSHRPVSGSSAPR